MKCGDVKSKCAGKRACASVIGQSQYEVLLVSLVHMKGMCVALRRLSERPSESFIVGRRNERG